MDFGLCLGDVVGLDFGEVRECALATFEADATDASHTWESRAGSLATWWEMEGREGAQLGDCQSILLFCTTTTTTISFAPQPQPQPLLHHNREKRAFLVAD